MSRTALYRCFDSEGVLLYVGISASPPVRLRTHCSDKFWFRRVHRVTVAWFESRESVETAEMQAIIGERSQYNETHNPKRPFYYSGRPPVPHLDLQTRKHLVKSALERGTTPRDLETARRLAVEAAIREQGECSGAAPEHPYTAQGECALSNNAHPYTAQGDRSAAAAERPTTTRR